MVCFVCLFSFTLECTFGQGFTVDKSNPSIQERLQAELRQKGEKLLELFNVDDESRALELGRSIFAEQSADEWTSSFREDFGPVNSGKVRLTMGDNYSTVHVIVNIPKIGDWRNFQLVFKNDGDLRTERINIVLAAPPSDIGSGDFIDTNVLKQLDEYATQLGSENGLSGSLLIAKHDQVLVEKTYGIANHDTGRKINSDTPFNLASTGKMFTAVGILQLFELGKLSLSDPLIKFLPDYPNKEFASNTTVAHLLSHGSGVGEFWDSEFEKHWDKVSTHQQYLPFIHSKPLVFSPAGSQGSYSNSGFILLGLIIESVSGVSYYDFIEQNIFRPAQMENSGYYQRNQEDKFAVGYLELGNDEVIKERGGLMGSSAGGGYSTCRDLLKFRNALMNHQLLKKETFEMATSQQTVLNGGGMLYGYGFVINDGFQSGFGHGGQGPGAGTMFNVDKSSGLTVILLSNKLNGAYTELMFTLKELMKR